MDSKGFCTALHESGINLRYLGEIAKLAEAKKIFTIRTAAIREMFIRAAKVQLRKRLKEALFHTVAATIQEFLNLLFAGTEENSKSKSEDKGKEVVDEIKNDSSEVQNIVEVTNETTTTNTTTTSSSNENKEAKPSNNNNHNAASVSKEAQEVWQSIVKDVERKFKFTLPNSRDADPFIRKTVVSFATLRGLCIQIGFQMRAANYQLGRTREVFKLDDVISIFPIVKFAEVDHPQLDNILTSARQFLAQGNFDYANDLLSDGTFFFPPKLFFLDLNFFVFFFEIFLF